MVSDAGGAIARRRRDVSSSLSVLCKFSSVCTHSPSMTADFDIPFSMSSNGYFEICYKERRSITASPLLPYPLPIELVSKSIKEKSFESNGVSSFKSEICLIISLRSTGSRAPSGNPVKLSHRSTLTNMSPIS
ncbi:unnamed protein product [Arabis nemorensis]|uniref:Uncharacterized protein n=1 Tax=Arabis nemorensis TaxID=586526 RepID=A0A565AY65_9BRAS|nr:unnamed protein product [Arabis nemorensis]